LHNAFTSPGDALAARSFFGASVVCLLCYGWLTWTTRHAVVLQFSGFLFIALVCALLSFFMVWLFTARGLQIPFTWILITAILFRLIGVAGAPLLEDDFYRYLWDGYRTAESGDPYSLPPSWFFTSDDVPAVFEQVLSGINYPDIATVYGPVCQWIFAAAYTIAPAQTWPLQMFAALADIGVLLLLRTVCRHNVLLLYAWSPLLIKEFAFTAHPDVLAVLMVLLAIRLRIAGYALVAGAFLGLALGIKVFALLLAPLVLIYRGNVTRSLLAAAGFFLTLLGITLWYGSLSIWAPQGLRVMADSWLFNAPLYLLLTNLLSFGITKILLLSVFFIFAITLCYKYCFTLKAQLTSPSGNAETIIRADLLYGVFLLCIPVLNPWYVVWILPFAVLHPRRWAWAASVAVLLSYSAIIDANASAAESYQVPLSVLILEFGLIGVAALIDWKYPLSSRYRREENSAA
jgi:alpha-1,6-mannosyltransferase